MNDFIVVFGEDGLVQRGVRGFNWEGRGGGILIVKHPRFCETLKASSHIVFGGI